MPETFEETVGSGTNLFPAGRLSGSVRWFHNPADVVTAEATGLPEVIAFVSKGGMTFLSPILADVKAVVCTAGSLESPLAILAREFEVPCVMGTDLVIEHVEKYWCPSFTSTDVTGRPAFRFKDDALRTSRSAAK